MPDLQQLYQAVIDGDADASKTVTEEALAEGIDALSLVTDYMVPAMDEVGRRFEEGEYFVPELLIAARAMKASMELIRPILIETGVPPTGRVVIGTVKGDLHDIGKNLVAAMLEGGGFEVLDLGADVDPAKFVEAARERNADIVAMSALLTTTMPSMKSTIDALIAAELRDKVKVMIGGAPVSAGFGEQIGADSYAENASLAVAMAREFLKGEPVSESADASPNFSASTSCG